jgi:hypothetical protein
MDKHDDWTDGEIEWALQELQTRLDGNPFDARANSEWKELNAYYLRRRDEQVS